MANNGGKATKGGAARARSQRNGASSVGEIIDGTDLGVERKSLIRQLMFVLCLYDKHATQVQPSHTCRISYQHLDPSFFSQDFRAMDAQQDHPRIPGLKFRVLIIGRANAGKTSILQKVCDTTEKPEIFGLDSSRTRDQDHRVRSRS
jgi:hypothetical protein